MYFADEAILCTNPELSSCRDSDKMIGFIASKSYRSENQMPPVIQRLLVTRYDANRAEKDESLHLKDIEELLGLPILGVIPESKSVLAATNLGQPVIMGTCNASVAYRDMVNRFLGNSIDMKFTKPDSASNFLSRLFASGKG